ncbi:MAG: valine--tRNA ligase [Verrucomicrobia bacterium]|nr:valine--tRNA ligase [Verrucomicrobiota bacterium]
MSAPPSSTATSEIPKAYEPAAVEAKWQSRWARSRCFEADPKSSKPAFSIVMPPPNITGVLTLGHVLNNTIQDILARRARMEGKEVLWLPGTDHAGIATQTVVERTLKKAGVIRHRDDLGRDKFLEKVWEWKEKHGGIITEQLKKLGASCDWSRERFTLDPEYSRCVQRVFVELYKKGLIYRGKRMVNWDPVSLTALSDEEVIMKPQNGTLYFFKVEVAEQPGTWLTIATTRPETIPGDTAVAVNPRDARYAHLIGQHVVRPLPEELPREQKLIPIVGDDAVDFEFGTGVLKVTPAHDKADFEIGQRHKLLAIGVIDSTGCMNAAAGESLVGLDRFEARNVAAERLRELGALTKEEPYQNNVGCSERTDVPIEPMLSEQWFLKYPSVEKAREIVANGALKFFPERWTKVYDHWMENIQDWCISRQLWWGHRIPAWHKVHILPGIHRPGEGYAVETVVSLEPPDDSGNWRQEEDVLDTWFSSWLWPFATMGWPEKTETLAKFYPTTDLVTGPDILFFWVARMIMAGCEFAGDIPFRNVYFTGLIRDAKGRKMSKSLGNSPDVLELISKYGADGLRFGLLRIAPQGQDIRFDEKQIEEGRNFANKIWNAARFYQMQEPALPFGTRISYRPAPYILDIEAKLRATQEKVGAALDEFRFNEAAQALYDFFWSDYCDWFVEAAKVDIVGVEAPEAGKVTERAIAKEAALFTMYRVLTEFLHLVHPFMPHLSEELFERLTFPPRPATAAAAATDAAPEAASAAEEDESPARRLRRRAKFLSFQRLAGPVGLSGSAEETAAAQRTTADLYETVRLARNLRAEYGVATNKPAKFILRLREEVIAAAEKDAWPFAASIRALTRMVNAEDLALQPDYQPPRGTPSAVTPLGDLFLPLAGLVDVAAERARIEKEIARAEADRETALKQLSNPNFIARAPAEKVAEHRQRHADTEARLAKLRTMLAALGADE